MRKKFFLLSIFLLFTNCQKELLNEDIGECDTMGNYYERGDHYISREFYNDEDGTLRYDKLFEKSDKKNSICNPYNFEIEP